MVSMQRCVSAIAGSAIVLLLAGCAGAETETDGVLLQPGDSSFQAQAPDTFRVQFATSEGDFTAEIYREWAPQGADRFYNLVRAGYYDGNRFFRVIPGFMAQFGIHGEPAVNEAWAESRIPDDPVQQTNARGTIVFAMAGPDTRTTQLFINFANNEQLDGMGFAPFGRIIEGMDIVDRINGEYGEGAPRGRGPDQVRLRAEGNDYLRSSFPNLDYIESARIAP